MCVNRPLVESALFTASAVDGDGNIVCETRTVSYSTLPYGDIGATSLCWTHHKPSFDSSHYFGCSQVTRKVDEQKQNMKIPCVRAPFMRPRNTRTRRLVQMSCRQVCTLPFSGLMTARFVCSRTHFVCALLSSTSSGAFARVRK